jgi:trigger factor
MYAQLEVVEGRPIENNDTAIIDFEGFRDGKSIDGAKATDYMLTLGSDSLIPGFEEQLVGMKREETREIKVTFPADYNNSDLAGKDATFTIALKRSRKSAPELNDEFAKTSATKRGRAERGVKKTLSPQKNDQASARGTSKLVDAHL